MAKAAKKATTKGKTTKATKRTSSPSEASASPVDVAAEVTKALDELSHAATSGAKKAIRRRLRSLGHAGGLGKKKASAGE